MVCGSSPLATAVSRVIETSFLLAVNAVVGRIEIDDDLLGSLGVSRQVQIDPKRFQGRFVGDDFLVSLRCVGVGLSEFEPIERAFSGQRRATISLSNARVAGDVNLANSERQHLISAQIVVIIEVFVSEGDGHGSLGEQVTQRVFDGAGIAMIDEAFGESVDDGVSEIDLAQQHGSSVG